MTACTQLFNCFIHELGAPRQLRLIRFGKLLAARRQGCLSGPVLGLLVGIPVTRGYHASMERDKEWEAQEDKRTKADVRFVRALIDKSCTPYSLINLMCNVYHEEPMRKEPGVDSVLRHG